MAVSPPCSSSLPFGASGAESSRTGGCQGGLELRQESCTNKLSCTCRLFIYLDELQSPSVLLGLCLAVNCMCEVPIFYYSGAILDRLGLDGAIHMVSFAYCLRLLYYYLFMAVFNTPWLVLLAEPLHAITFALGWAAGNERVRLLAPPGWKVTMQQIFAACWFGLGSGSGGLVGGLLHDRMGSKGLFGTACVVMLIG